MALLYVKYSQQALIDHCSSLFFIVLQPTLPHPFSQCNRPSFPRYILLNEEVFSYLIVTVPPGFHWARNFSSPTAKHHKQKNNYGHRIESYLQHRPDSSRSFQPSVFAEPANQSGGPNSGGNRERAAVCRAGGQCGQRAPEPWVGAADSKQPRRAAS